jgi:DNA-directed RNA polymerase specialized sigma24 family protein
MAAPETQSGKHLSSEPVDPQTLEELYAILSPFARKLVYSFAIAAWRGQEEDLAQDLVQETMRRVFERNRRTKDEGMETIYSPKYMMLKIATNYCRDLRRKDKRLLRPLEHYYTSAYASVTEPHTSFADIATEHVYQNTLFLLIAREVAAFPKGQRRALLIDLASYMYFSDDHHTSLQQAFLEVGIQLKHYKDLLPVDPRERARHLSLLHHAYKRLSHLPSVQAYVTASS